MNISPAMKPHRMDCGLLNTVFIALAAFRAQPLREGLGRAALSRAGVKARRSPAMTDFESFGFMTMRMPTPKMMAGTIANTR